MRARAILGYECQEQERREDYELHSALHDVGAAGHQGDRAHEPGHGEQRRDPLAPTRGSAAS